MVKRAATVAAVGLLVVGGLTAAGKWRDGRLAECGRRSTTLAALDLLSQGPEGFRADDPSAECDPDSVVASASRQFTAAGGPAVDQLAGRAAAPADESAVTAFYQRLLATAHWEIATRKPAPGPNPAALCATKQLDFGKAHLTLSFPTANMYEISVADSVDAGARCV